MHLSTDELDILDLLEETADDRCGALVVFAGTVRNNNEGREVSGMSYTAHDRLAENTLAEVEQQALHRFDISQCRVIHRTGELSLGDISVLVVVRAAHRDQAFEAGRWAIDTLKQSVPVWKQEHYRSGDSEYLEGIPINTVNSHDNSPGE